MSQISESVFAPVSLRISSRALSSVSWLRAQSATAPLPRQPERNRAPDAGSPADERRLAFEAGVHASYGGEPRARSKE
jgi:hypothetical protein